MQPPSVVGNKPSKSLGRMLGEAALVVVAVGIGLDIMGLAMDIRDQARQLFFKKPKQS